MKSVVFGNPHIDWWKLSLDGISAQERVVYLTGELSVGFFRASTPMCLSLDKLSGFATEVHELDRTLKGTASLESDILKLRIAVNHVGYLHISGRYENEGNGLDFNFRSDQTQLTPLGKWLDYILSSYVDAKPPQSALETPRLADATTASSERSERLRFTGENPPPELWDKHPNWRNAYEEEGEDGQDETTLMPHEVQTFVDKDTSFTAGTVRFHDGREFPAFLSLGERGVDGCDVYETDTPWRIYFSYPESRWLPFGAEWLPEQERPPTVSFENDRVFPLQIRMSVPWRQGGITAVYEVTKDGDMHEIAA